MTIQQIIDYVFFTPFNTNKAILIEMLENLIIDHGGSLDGDQPDIPGGDGNNNVIYDGGIEA